MPINPETQNDSWISVPLKKCLMFVCSSCPDQLIHSAHDTAIYSVNYEESISTDDIDFKNTSSLIWEGHGLLSTILNDTSNTLQVTGKLKKIRSSFYSHTIQVFIQLHPSNTNIPEASVSQSLQTLPSVKLLLNESVPYRMEKPYPGHQKESNDLSNINDMELIPVGNKHKLSPMMKEKACSNTMVDVHHYDIFPSSVKNIKPNTHESVKNTVDAYYHQSRRKKRDTKPPNINDVRAFVEIDRNSQGMYVLPAEVDSWTVLDLGKVVWDRPSFHNQRYIYPVGYRVKNDTQYTCQILDGGDEPIFQLDADDNPGEVWRGPTPTTVWTIAVRRAFAIRNMDYGHNPVGPDFFGLRKNTIAKMIQDLPNADKCQNYIWQNFEPTSGSRGKAMRRTSARIGSASSASSTGIPEPVTYVSTSPRGFQVSPLMSTIVMPSSS
ncbi:hypothetical protein BDF14DRAFT_1731492 [Spinellus fusiger]|nr:hypothetical protein BDF14DRAFT_1731492 [Spinellus fusiger]